MSRKLGKAPASEKGGGQRLEGRLGPQKYRKTAGATSPTRGKSADLRWTGKAGKKRGRGGGRGKISLHEELHHRRVGT